MTRPLPAAFLALAFVAAAAFAQSPADSGEIDRSPAMMRPMIERFQADRTTQMVLGMFAGTFVYCIAAALSMLRPRRLESRCRERSVPPRW